MEQKDWVVRELHALRGHTTDIPDVMRHIRIFLSSTFTDTGPTRDFLMQHVCVLRIYVPHECVLPSVESQCLRRKPIGVLIRFNDSVVETD